MSFLVLFFFSSSFLRSRIIIANTFADLTYTHSCRNSINTKKRPTSSTIREYARLCTSRRHTRSRQAQPKASNRQRTNEHTIDLRQSSSLTLPSDEEKRDRHTSAQHQPTTSERAVAAAPTRRLSLSSCFIQSVIIHFSSFPLPPSEHTHAHTYGARSRVYRLSFVVKRAASDSYSRNTHKHTCKVRMATITNTNTSTKVIRIQDDEKELLFRLREIYGSLNIVVVFLLF